MRDVAAGVAPPVSVGSDDDVGYLRRDLLATAVLPAGYLGSIDAYDKDDQTDQQKHESEDGKQLLVAHRAGPSYSTWKEPIGTLPILARRPGPEKGAAACRRTLPHRNPRPSCRSLPAELVLELGDLFLRHTGVEKVFLGARLVVEAVELPVDGLPADAERDVGEPRVYDGVIAVFVGLLVDAVIVVVGDHVVVEHLVIAGAAQGLEQGAGEARPVLAFGAVDEVGTVVGDHLAQALDELLRVLVAAVVDAHVQCGDVAGIVETLVPRHVEGGVGIVALDLLLGVRLVEDELNAGLLRKRAGIRRTAVLVVARRGGAVYGALRHPTAPHGPEVREGHIAGIVVPVARVDCGERVLGRQVLALLAQGDGAGIALLQPCDLPQRVAVVKGDVDVGESGIGADERVARLRIEAVVVRDVLKLVTVAEGDVAAVAVLEAHGVELVDGHVEVHAPELRLFAGRECARRLLLTRGLLRRLLLLLGRGGASATADERKAQNQA